MEQLHPAEQIVERADRGVEGDIEDELRGRLPSRAAASSSGVPVNGGRWSSGTAVRQTFAPTTSSSGSGSRPVSCAVARIPANISAITSKGIPGEDEHARSEADAAGLTGDERERVERIEGRREGLGQPVASGVGRPRFERVEAALCHPEAVVAELFRSPGDGRERVWAGTRSDVGRVNPRRTMLTPFVSSGDLGEPFRDGGADLVWRVFL